MKHLNTILFILFAALFLPGCSGYDIDSLFDKPAEARVQDSLSAVKKELTEAADGWIATYKIGESAITLYLHIRFNPDNTLSLQIPNKDGSANVQEGIYTLSYTQQFNLIFDTKSFFSDLTKINLGDFVLELVKKEDGQYIFHGFDNETNKQTCTLILRKAAKDEKAQFAAMTMDEYIVLITAKKNGRWNLSITGENLWADINNNERFDSGEEIVGRFSKPIQSQALTIYGDTITNLFCQNNSLTSIDVSHCPHLEILSCYFNQLTNLDLTKNTALEQLVCIYNQLENLDVTKSPVLTHLYCYSNKLTSLNVTQNPILEQFTCNDNQLTELDVTQNPILITLSCYTNKLTSLNVTQNPKLNLLNCKNNQIESLDVTKNPILQSLNCSTNQLSELDVTQNPILNSLYCDHNKLTSLNVIQNPMLQIFSFDNNQLTNMDISSNPKLQHINCFNNQIKDKDMNNLVNNLPPINSGIFYVIDTKSSTEKNICTKEQVMRAKSKGWRVLDSNGYPNGTPVDYEGS